MSNKTLKTSIAKAAILALANTKVAFANSTGASAGKNPVEEINTASSNVTPQLRTLAFTLAGVIIAFVGILIMIGGKAKQWALDHLFQVVLGLLVVSVGLNWILWFIGIFG